MGLIALLVVIAGFFPTYVEPMLAGKFVAKPFVHLHGAVFTLWILMSILQPWLVVSGMAGTHRKVGIYGAMLAFAVIFMGVLMAFISAKVDIANGEDIRPKAFLLIPLTDMMLFALFVGLGLFHRRQPEIHKRLMLLATVAILPAAFARLLGNLGFENVTLTILIMNSFVFAALIYDWLRRRTVHPAYLLGGALLLIVHFLRDLVAPTPQWRDIAEQLLKLG